MIYHIMKDVEDDELIRFLRPSCAVMGAFSYPYYRLLQSIFLFLEDITYHQLNYNNLLIAKH